MIAAGTRRHARGERDPCGAGVRPRLVLLAQALLLARSLREHDDDLALARELGRRAHRIHVAFAPAAP